MQNGTLFVDHVFMLIDACEVEAVTQALGRFGLAESTRRIHEGLGTANIFYCFDNAFIEILWVARREEAMRTELGRMLIERIDGRASGAAPFGIGFRTGDAKASLPFPTWNFEPPAALGFRSIPIAISSRDRGLPLLFRAQRSARPDAWTDGKAGGRQQRAGLTEITALRYAPPPNIEVSNDLRSLERLGMLELDAAPTGPRLTVRMSDASGSKIRELELRSPLAMAEAV